MNFQELLVLCNTGSLLIVPGAWAFTMYLKPRAVFNVYTYIPWQNGWTRAAVLTFETLLAAPLAIMLILMVHVVLLFLQKCMEDMELNMKQLNSM